MELTPQIFEEIARRAREDRHEPIVPFEMLKRFYFRKVDELERVRSLLTEQKEEEVKLFLHQWKGNCESYGLGFMGERSRYIEDLFRRGRLEHVAEEFAFIEEYLKLKREEFEAEPPLH